MPRVGTQANSLAALPKFKRELVERELPAVADAGVTTLATVYHACHREFAMPATAAASRSSISWSCSARGSASHAEDLYKRLKLIGDIDDIIVETAPMIAAHSLDLDTVRDALVQEFAAARN